ncbi:unnamed protein product [Brassica rapa subsp. narinosa]|uniref:(rape) hypothetical protein n=1 Tax=Brassica napus TaxID=3708 RepID=A0A816V6V0_BRANA|nr:unnamed protein product [Brassica napus]
MVDSNHETEIRCHHCAGSLTKNLETSEWTVSPFIRDSFSMSNYSFAAIVNKFGPLTLRTQTFLSGMIYICKNIKNMSLTFSSAFSRY